MVAKPVETEAERLDRKAKRYGRTPTGIPIVDIQSRMTNTGDGLSKAQSALGVRVPEYAETYIGTRVRHSKDIFDYSRDGDGDVVAVLVQSFKALNMTIGEDAVNIGVLEVTATKVDNAEAERKAGQGAFKIDDPDGVLDASQLPNAGKAREGHEELAAQVDDAMKGSKVTSIRQPRKTTTRRRRPNAR